MKKLFPIAAAALLLAGCGSDTGEPAPSSATAVATSATSSAASSSTAISTVSESTSATTPTPSEEPAPPIDNPTVTIDQLVITPNAAADHGVYLDPNTGSYYYCNTTQLTWDGIAPGVCDGAYDYDGANAKFQRVVEEWYSGALEENGLPSPNDAAFSYCSGDGVAMYTDGNEHPYADCAQPPAPVTDPSPWVTGQIEWENCTAANSVEYCREILN